MIFTIQQPKKKGIKPGLPWVFIDSVHFLNKSSDHLVKNLGENDFYHLNLEFNANVWNLLEKKGFPLVTTGITLKNSKRAYPAKIYFIIH